MQAGVIGKDPRAISVIEVQAEIRRRIQQRLYTGPRGGLVPHDLDVIEQSIEVAAVRKQVAADRHRQRIRRKRDAWHRQIGGHFDTIHIDLSLIAAA